MENMNFLWGTPEDVQKAAPANEPAFRLVNPANELPFAAVPFFLPGKPIRTISAKGRTLARITETDDAVWCFAAGITPPDLSAPRDAQAAALFPALEDVLKEADMTFRNVVRTWLYIDRVCEWYTEFNAARSAFFETRNVFNTFLPASTGIGTANLDGAALTGGFIALKPKSGSQAKAVEVASPLQAPAMAYKSSFSRAAEISSAAGRELFISGTASIEPNSHEVAFVGDIVRQIDCTMKAVRAILTSRQMDFKDVTRAVVYLKEAAFCTAWRAWCKAHPDFPLAKTAQTVCDVCRDEWLFEIECDAFLPPQGCENVI